MWGRASHPLGEPASQRAHPGGNCGFTQCHLRSGAEDAMMVTARFDTFRKDTSESEDAACPFLILFR